MFPYPFLPNGKTKDVELRLRVGNLVVDVSIATNYRVRREI